MYCHCCGKDITGEFFRREIIKGETKFFHNDCFKQFEHLIRLEKGVKDI